jgi:hypothetical protein
MSESSERVWILSRLDFDNRGAVEIEVGTERAQLERAPRIAHKMLELVAHDRRATVRYHTSGFGANLTSVAPHPPEEGGASSKAATPARLRRARRTTARCTPRPRP